MKERPGRVGQQVRQQAYLRALQTTQNLTVHYGQFLQHAVRMPLVQPVPGGANTIEVWKTEEKGSDVNLASYLLLDAFRKECEVSVVITNDSDLAEPIRLVRKELGIKVVVLHPLPQPTIGSKPPHPSYQLRKAASKSIVIKVASLAASQFPDRLTDSVGTISKPKGW